LVTSLLWHSSLAWLSAEAEGGLFRDDTVKNLWKSVVAVEVKPQRLGSRIDFTLVSGTSARAVPVRAKARFFSQTSNIDALPRMLTSQRGLSAYRLLEYLIAGPWAGIFVSYTPMRIPKRGFT
jgi:hypothetical protein